MATADVIVPNPEDLLSRSLIFNNVLVEAAPSAAAAKDAQSANTRFAFNNIYFIDLQLYLRAAEKLPKNETAFEAEFPNAAFTKYLGTDGTFEKLRAVLSGGDGIYKHCETFQNTVVVDMRTFCKDACIMVYGPVLTISQVVGWSTLVSQSRTAPMRDQ